MYVLDKVEGAYIHTWFTCENTGVYLKHESIFSISKVTENMFTVLYLINLASLSR